jgi:hypothetical protein
MHEIFLSEERFISPGSTEISRAKFVIRHQNDNHKFINTVKEVKLDSCGSVSLAHSKYLSSIKSCKQYNIPIVSLNGIGGRTNPLTSAGILSRGILSSPEGRPRKNPRKKIPGKKKSGVSIPGTITIYQNNR